VYRSLDAAADRQKALDFGAQEFVDLDRDTLKDVGKRRSGVRCHRRATSGSGPARLIRPGGTLVSIVGPSEARPVDGLAIDFVVESDRVQLSEIVQRVRDGRLRTNIGTSRLSTMPSPDFNSTKRRAGKTVIRVRPLRIRRGRAVLPSTFIVGMGSCAKPAGIEGLYRARHVSVGAEPHRRQVLRPCRHLERRRNPRAGADRHHRTGVTFTVESFAKVSDKTPNYTASCKRD